MNEFAPSETISPDRRAYSVSVYGVNYSSTYQLGTPRSTWISLTPCETSTVHISQLVRVFQLEKRAWTDQHQHRSRWETECKKNEITEIKKCGMQENEKE